MKISTGFLLISHKVRRLLYLCLAVVMFISVAVFAPSKTALAASGDWVHSSISEPMTKKYGKYHDVPGLPAKFSDYALNASNQFYFSTLDLHALYCVEIENHYWYSQPDEFTQSAQFPDSNPSKQRMLAYALAQGQRVFGEDEESVKRYTATQIVVWIIAEGYESNTTYLDAILSPAVGSYPDDAAFAPTNEVGRLARQLLEGAKSFAAGTDDVSTLYNPVIPSFMSLTEADAQSFTMKNTGSHLQVDLLDENKVIGRDWPDYLKVVDSGGLSILGFHDDTMSVRGDPKQETTIKLSGPYGGYEVRYLDTTKTTATGKPFQKMARLARLDGEVPLYFKVAPEGAVEQTTSLDLKKTVSGGNSTTTTTTAKEFKFTVFFREASGTVPTGVLLNGAAFKSGDTLTLTHGATASFTNIPVGTTYEIFEWDYSADGYTSDKTNNTVRGTAATKERITVSYLNTYKSSGPKGGGGNGSGSDSKTALPKTGDTAFAPSVILAAVLLISAITAFFIRRFFIRRPVTGSSKQ